MDKENIRKIIQQSIDQAVDGQEVENPKMEFKLKWMDLKTKSGLSEFLKDTTSIANTVGLDGFIVFGFDNDRKIYKDSVFMDSNLRDQSEIHGIFSKRLSDIFTLNPYDITINKHKLSVLHIPPVLNKPIVIKNYQTFHQDGKLKKEEEHKIFVRKNTGARSATKYDIDLMYYDRKNIIPEYDFRVIAGNLDFVDFPFNGANYRCDINFTIENIGRRPIAINNISLEVYLPDSDTCTGFYVEGISTGLTSLRLFKKNSIIIPPNSIFQADDLFFGAQYMNLQAYRSTSYTNLEIIMILKLSTGRRIRKVLEFIP